MVKTLIKEEFNRSNFFSDSQKTLESLLPEISRFKKGKFGIFYRAGNEHYQDGLPAGDYIAEIIEERNFFSRKERPGRIQFHISTLPHNAPANTNMYSHLVCDCYFSEIENLALPLLQQLCARHNIETLEFVRHYHVMKEGQNLESVKTIVH